MDEKLPKNLPNKVSLSGTMKRQYPTTPILGLTATATQRALEG